MENFTEYIAVVVLGILTCLEYCVLTYIYLFGMLTFDQCKYVVHLCQALLVKVAVVDVEEEDDSSNVLTSVEP